MTEHLKSVVDYDAPRLSKDVLASEFSAATPFPHIVVDNFIDPVACQAMLDEFDGVDRDGSWGHYVHYNERKLGLTKFDRMAPATQRVIRELSSDRFVAWLESVTGLKDLLADPDLDGGGLHKIERDGFLNVHVDFLAHTVQKTWSRQLNLLLYLNHDWKEEYEGALELWNADMTQCEKKVMPVFNRCVIFHTCPGSYHGHPTPLTCPEGMSRKSLALYYFRDEGKTVPLNPTDYRARPEDSAMKHALVYADRTLLQIYSSLKRYAGLKDGTVQKLLKRF